MQYIQCICRMVTVNTERYCELQVINSKHWLVTCSACIRWSVNGLRCLKSRLVLMRAVSHIWNTFSALMKLYFTTINQFGCNVPFLLPISKINRHLDRWPYLWLNLHVGSLICSILSSPQQPLSGHSFVSPTEHIWKLQQVHENITAWAYLIVWDQSHTPWEMEGDMEWIQKMAAGSLSQYGHRITMSYSHSLRRVPKVKIVSPAATRLTQKAYVLMLRHSESKTKLLYFSTGAKNHRQCVCVCRNIA